MPTIGQSPSANVINDSHTLGSRERLAAATQSNFNLLLFMHHFVVIVVVVVDVDVAAVCGRPDTVIAQARFECGT